MTAPDFGGKAFDDLTDDELRQLEDHDWTPGQIMRAMSMALSDGNTVAFVQLLDRLSRKDPRKAAAILAVIEATA